MAHPTLRIVARCVVMLGLLAGAAIPVRAQACPSVTVRNPDGNYIVPGVLGDIPYSGDLALDAYVQQGDGKRPTIVVIHGGGWTSGSRTAHVGQILELLTRAGYHWLSIDYRLLGLARYEESLADLRAALAFARCNATTLGIDPNQLILLGEDSGAHLAALLAAERPAGVIGAVFLGGFYDLTAIPSAKDSLPAVARDRASPITRVVPQMPPSLVVHGGADRDAPIDQARRFCERIARVQQRCRFVESSGASHRLENWWPSQWSYKAELVRWLADLAGTAPPAHRARPGAVQKDLIYNPVTGLRLDAYVPRSDHPTPAVILIHGGGWEAGDKVTYITPLFEPLARAGLAWFSIDYRLTPAHLHEEQLEDVREAIRFVRGNAARFNIDPDAVVLLGESASGQMVAQLATEDRSLAGVVSFYGVYDLAAMVTDASPRSLLVRLFRRPELDEASRTVLRRYSPIHRAHKAMPPMLLVNGTGDKLWEQAQAFVARLRQLGARHELIALDGAPHGLENWEGHAPWTSYKRRVVDWILEAARRRGQ